MKLKILSINLRGAQSDGRFAGLVRRADEWRRNEGIAVICAQEHNLDPKRVDELRRVAQSRHFSLTVGFASEGTDGVH